MEDAKFFRERFSKLDGAGDLGDHILNVVRNKEVKIVREKDEADNKSTTSVDSDKTIRPADVSKE